MLTAADRPRRRDETGARVRAPGVPSRAEPDPASPEAGGRRPTPTSARAEPDVATDADLGRRARDGDRLAFARLYERFAPAVHGVLLASAPVAEAKDLVQEVFLLALRAIARLEEPERVGPWLLSIARNRAKDAHKTRRRAVELSAADEPSAPDPAPAEDAQEAQAALDAIRALPESYRETLVLRLVEGLSGPEIAARTGLTHGSVRVNLHRGMKLLREELARPRGSGR